LVAEKVRGRFSDRLRYDSGVERALRVPLCGGDMVSTVRVEAPEASRGPRSLVKEPGTTISADNESYALAA